ncbi:MAG: hypothetical protein PHX05_06470 [Acidobacteriota bacterium]|nr:hypothetical protein [Acidobacteriota bacterium]
MNKNYLEEMPAEIQEARRSVDLQAIGTDLSIKLSLTPAQQAALKDSLSSFLENIWNDKHVQLDMSAITPLNEREGQIVNREINERVFLKIIQALEKLGLNDNAVLFASGDIKLTARTLRVGEFASHDTDRLIYKKTESRRHGFFVRKIQHVIELEADYPEKGRWGEYEPIRIRVDSAEKVDDFLCQLNKAVKVGNFRYFVDIFSRFKLIK